MLIERALSESLPSGSLPPAGGLGGLPDELTAADADPAAVLVAVMVGAMTFGQGTAGIAVTDSWSQQLWLQSPSSQNSSFSYSSSKIR